MTGELYVRQNDLRLKVPKRVVVVGVGGVGSWVAYFFAKMGVEEVILVDHDTIEESNLNRTPFKYWQIGAPKVTSLAQVIVEERPDCNVMVFNKRWEEMTRDEKESVKCPNMYNCMDNVDSHPDIPNPITGGYNGTEVTMFVKPDYKNIFGTGPTGYTITPSFVIPPVIIASLIVGYETCEKWQRGGSTNMDDVTFNFDVKKLVRKLAAKKRSGAKPGDLIAEQEGSIQIVHPDADTVSLLHEDPRVTAARVPTNSTRDVFGTSSPDTTDTFGDDRDEEDDRDDRDDEDEEEI